MCQQSTMQQLQRVSVASLIICLLHYMPCVSHLLVSIGNTEVIANSVVILFTLAIDELLCDIMTVINTNWVKSMSLEDEDEDQTRSDLIAQRVQGRIQRLEKKDKIQAQTIKVNRQNIELIMQHIPELNKLKLHASIPPQDEYSLVSGDEYEDEEDDVKDLK